MKKKHYQFVYSGSWEGYKRFYKFARLKKFLSKIPEHELKRTQVRMKKGDFIYIGSYFLLKKGGLSVKF